MDILKPFEIFNSVRRLGVDFDEAYVGWLTVTATRCRSTVNSPISTSIALNAALAFDVKLLTYLVVGYLALASVSWLSTYVNVHRRRRFARALDALTDGHQAEALGALLMATRANIYSLMITGSAYLLSVGFYVGLNSTGLVSSGGPGTFEAFGMVASFAFIAGVEMFNGVHRNHEFDEIFSVVADEVKKSRYRGKL